MAYHIHAVTMKNFGPFESAHVQLDRPGLTVLEGQFDNAAMRADSNGAGKSMVIEAVVWCLYGQTLRPRLSPDDVVRRGSRGGAEVTVEIKGKKNIKVTRYRQHTSGRNTAHLIIDGQSYTPGTVAETTTMIENILGLDFDGFCNSVAFGARADIQSFYTATDVEKKRILSDLLGLDVYEYAAAIAKQKLDQARKELEQIENRIETLEARHEDAHEALNEATTDLDPESLQRTITDYTVKLQRISRALVKLRSSKDESDAAVADAQSAHAVKVRLYEKRYEEADATHTAAMSKLTETQREQRDANSRRLEVDRRMRDVSLLKGDCLTCGQPVTEKSRDGVLAGLTTQRSKHEHDAIALDIQAKQYEDEVDAVEWPAEPSEEFVESVRDWNKQIADKINTAVLSQKEMIRARDQAQDHYNSVEGQIKKLTAKAESLGTELEEERVKLEPAAMAMDTYEFWVKGFGARGLQSFLIEAEMNRINKAATGYAQRLVGAGARVRLSATSETKTKRQTREVIEIEASIPNCSATYAGASKGQKRRLDLSLMLAFHDLLAHRTAMPIDQLFVDELFDGMDQTGIETSTELLKELSATRPVLLITHDPRLRGAGDYIETVYHNGDGSAIMPQGGKKPPQTVKRTKRPKGEQRKRNRQRV